MPKKKATGRQKAPQRPELPMIFKQKIEAMAVESGLSFQYWLTKWLERAEQAFEQDRLNAQA